MPIRLAEAMLTNTVPPVDRPKVCMRGMQVPLNAQLQQTSDAGVPVVVSDPASAAAREYRQLAERVLAKLRDAEAAEERAAEMGFGAPPPLV